MKSECSGGVPPFNHSVPGPIRSIRKRRQEKAEVLCVLLSSYAIDLLPLTICRVAGRIGELPA